DLAAGAELSPPQNIPAAHDDRELDAPQQDPLSLAGNAQRLVDADAALAAVPKPFPTELQDHAFVLGLEGLAGRRLVHGVFHRGMRRLRFGIIRAWNRDW